MARRFLNIGDHEARCEVCGASIPLDSWALSDAARDPRFPVWFCTLACYRKRYPDDPDVPSIPPATAAPPAAADDEVW